MGDFKGISMPPPFNPECSNKPYGLWKTEVSFWEELTSLAPKKRALAVALAIPEGSKLRNKIFSELSRDELNGADGLQKLIAYLDKLYLKDDLFNARQMYSDLVRHKKTEKDSMDDFIMEFDRLCTQAEKYDVLKLSNGVKGFMLLDGAQLDHREELLVLTSVDFNEKDTIHEQMSSSLTKFFGKQAELQKKGLINNSKK